MSGSADESRAAAFLRPLLGQPAPRLAIVLGSGLGRVSALLGDARSIPFGEVPGFPRATVPGHQGELITGTLAGTRVLIQSGRFHLYEGHSAGLVALPVRVMARLGISTVLSTHACGAIRRTLVPGGVGLVADHINLTFRNPLHGPVLEGEPRFPDMSAPYDPELSEVAHRVARQHGIALTDVVYAGIAGPSYETAAEIRMLERCGADVVGMSTVTEVIAARARGLRCLALAAITNVASGLGSEPLSHEEVIVGSARMVHSVGRLVEGIARHPGVTE